MKTLIRAVAAGVLALFAVCAFAGGGDQSLVSPSQPHAIISTALPPNPSHYWAQIIWLDGNYLSNQKRSSYWVAPGEHKIGFRAIINAKRGPALLVTPATTYPVNLPTLTLDLKAGYTYYFAAMIPRTGIPSEWKPILIKKVKTGSD